MARHQDASGYLVELRDQIGTDWFAQICDWSLSGVNAPVDEIQIQQLYDLFAGKATFSSQAAATALQAPEALRPSHNSDGPRLFLSQLGPFHHFKRLSHTLTIEPRKRLTIIFGANGSGKSSLAEALKVLARSDPPQRPLQNVRGDSTDQLVSFDYSFSHDDAVSRWTSEAGFGTHADTIKYFDTDSVRASLDAPVNPSSVVAAAPFQLHLFTRCADIIRQLQEHIRQRIVKYDEYIENETALLRERFREFLDGEDMFEAANSGNHTPLKQSLDNPPLIAAEERERYAEARHELQRIRSASTGDGLVAMRQELELLRTASSWLGNLRRRLRLVTLADYVNIRTQRMQQEVVQQQLASQITPAGSDIKRFVDFLRSVQQIYDFGSTPDPCPFCQRDLDDRARTLIRKYQRFLMSETETEIKRLAQKEDELASELQALRQFDLTGTALSTAVIPTAVGHHLSMVTEAVSRAIPEDLRHVSLSGELDDALPLATVAEARKLIAKEIRNRYRSIQAVMQNADGRRQRQTALEQDIRTHDYRVLFDSQRPHLQKLLRLCEERADLVDRRDSGNFPVFLRRLTESQKVAHNELLMTTFEETLAKEYLALTDRSMKSFGIELSSRGADQEVVAVPGVGGHDIKQVLSEGEQKIHALALFFAELQNSNCDIVVLDDPANSCDYNYIRNCCERIRSYVVAQPNTQVLIFTHNWEFFVEMNHVLNNSASNIGSEKDVLLLEGCCVASTHLGKTYDLKQRIEASLATDAVSNRGERELVQMLMRRLVESVVNEQVFAGQRLHMKNNPGIKMSEYTKLVPLMPSEADRLSSIYRKVSPALHDDAKNYYTEHDKETFQRWYLDICDIERRLKTQRANPFLCHVRDSGKRKEPIST